MTGAVRGSARAASPPASGWRCATAPVGRCRRSIRRTESPRAGSGRDASAGRRAAASNLRIEIYINLNSATTKAPGWGGRRPLAVHSVVASGADRARAGRPLAPLPGGGDRAAAPAARRRGRSAWGAVRGAARAVLLGQRRAGLRPAGRGRALSRLLSPGARGRGQPPRPGRAASLRAPRGARRPGDLRGGPGVCLRAGDLRPRPGRFPLYAAGHPGDGAAGPGPGAGRWLPAGGGLGGEPTRRPPGAPLSRRRGGGGGRAGRPGRGAAAAAQPAHSHPPGRGRPPRQGGELPAAPAAGAAAGPAGRAGRPLRWRAGAGEGAGPARARRQHPGRRAPAALARAVSRLGASPRPAPDGRARRRGRPGGRPGAATALAGLGHARARRQGCRDGQRGAAPERGLAAGLPVDRRWAAAGGDRPRGGATMRVLVTGGTGFIGAATVDALRALDHGHELRCLTRHADRPSPWGDAVPLVRGDVRDAASLRRAVADVDVVVHCVQFPNHPVENRRRGYTYQAIDAEGTTRLVAACQAARVRRIVYLSGAGTRPGRAEPWFRAKEMAEAAIRGSGLEYVIFRPSWIYGRRDRSLNRFVQLVRYLPLVPVIGNGQTRVQPALVDDVARVVALGVDEPRASGQAFELGGPERLSMDEILHTVQRLLGRHQPLVHLPVGLVKLPAWLLAQLPNPPLSPAAIDFILMDETVDPGPAEALFGVRFRTLAEGLRTYLPVKDAAGAQARRPA